MELEPIPDFMRRTSPVSRTLAADTSALPLAEDSSRAFNPERNGEATPRGDDLMACRGILVDMKPMKMTGKLRVVIEVEQELANDAFEKLGKFVNPAKSRHIAMAVINE